MADGAGSYRRFLDGDESGLVEIIRLYNDGLTLYINSLVNNLSAADELSEEVFVKLGVKKPHFSQTAAFRTWLYAIGRNLALDYLRKNSKTKSVPLDSETETADRASLERGVLSEERKLTVHKAMRKLKPEYAQVLWLQYFEGFCTKDIARIMKRSAHSIETLAYRARQALRAELQKEGFTYEDL